MGCLPSLSQCPPWVFSSTIYQINYLHSNPCFTVLWGANEDTGSTNRDACHGERYRLLSGRRGRGRTMGHLKVWMDSLAVVGDQGHGVKPKRPDPAGSCRLWIKSWGYLFGGHLQRRGLKRATRSDLPLRKSGEGQRVGTGERESRGLC